MSPKKKLIKRVCDVRKRIRDVAAGKAQQDEERRLEARETEERIEQVFDTLLDEAPERFAAESSARSLLRFDDERGATRRQLQVAEKNTATATAASERSRAVMFERERELRSSEKLLERTHNEESAKFRRAEQMGVDDMSGSRGGRSE